MSGRDAFHPYLIARRGTTAHRVLLAVFCLLGLAFFRLQVLEHDRYELRSKTNRLRPVPLPAPRGLILDRRGEVIAENVPGYSVSLLASSEDSLRAMVARVAQVIAPREVPEERVVARFRALPYEPALVLKDAPFELVSRLEERRPVLPGLVIQREPKRLYPDGGVVAHLVGYVGEVAEGERASPRFAARRSGAIVGKDGLEREYEDSLAGEDGVRFVEVDALGRVVRDEGAAASLLPVPGHLLRTTIDLDLQRFVASVFPAGKRGAIVAMDPRDGHVLALYSSPSYDPNAFVGGIDRALWDALNTNEAKPLLDRAIGTRYPPASTFKLATATIAIRRGLATPDTRMPVPCTGGLQYGDRVFRCWLPQGHGSLTLEQAIASSCDVYFYQLGLRVGVRALLEDGDILGFRSRSGVDLPGEIAPSFPQNTAYFDRLYGKGHWTSAVALNLAIGQGENAQTLMNMVRFYAALANGGRLLVPRIIDEPAPQARGIEVAESTLAAMRLALIAVVERGTARGARLASIRLAGKTGTAQNPHGPDHGWFVGFAPADSPRVVVGGILEFGLHGTAMAPIVARVIERYLLGPDASGGVGGDSAPLILPEDSTPAAEALDSVRPPSPVPGRRPPASRRRPPSRPPSPAAGSREGRSVIRILRERFDRSLTVVALTLSAYGVLVLYSAGQTDVPGAAAHLWERQLLWLALGILAAVLVQRVSPRLLEWAAPALYAAGIVILLLTLVVGTGAGTAATVKSWIAIGGHRIGQPSELVKLAVVVMLARYLAGRREPPASLRELLVPVAIASLPAGLVALQPDLGSAIVFAGILFAMLYWGGVPLRYLVLLASPVISLVLAFSAWTWGAWIFLIGGLLVVWRPYVWEGLAVLGANVGMGIVALPLWMRLATYQQNRFLSFLNPELDARATGWHIIQSKIAIGSGGWLGQGFTRGPQKRLNFLPSQHTDFVFSVVGEELGLVGVVAALALFFALLAILIRIARRAPEPFGSLVAFGIVGLLFTHIFENVGMTANVMPITGIPLPFFSYGGSFLLTCFLAIGLALRVAREGRDMGYRAV